MKDKEKPFYFCVDKNLRVCSWGREIQQFTGEPSPSALKRKYYQVFPRLLMKGKDVVKQSLSDNKTFVLNGYAICCPYGQSQSDIKIDPIKNRSGNVVGAKISGCAHPACSAEILPENAQHLMNIGKQATIFAHRIRNPLNAIKGAVVYLREKYQKDETLREFTDIMNDEIEKLNNSISKFLSASLSHMELTDTDITSILKKVEIITSLQSNARKIKSSYKYGEVPPVKIDAFQFEQAILNIINNALEAMPSGGKLNVRSSVMDRFGKKWAMIEVSDSGMGIPEGAIHGFSIGSAYTGRGYGLFIAREVIQSFGGNLEIESKKGTGTIMKLFLPVI